MNTFLSRCFLRPVISHRQQPLPNKNGESAAALSSNARDSQSKISRHRHATPCGLWRALINFSATPCGLFHDLSALRDTYSPSTPNPGRGYGLPTGDSGFGRDPEPERCSESCISKRGRRRRLSPGRRVLLGSALQGDRDRDHRSGPAFPITPCCRPCPRGCSGPCDPI